MMKMLKSGKKLTHSALNNESNQFTFKVKLKDLKSTRLGHGAEIKGL